MQVCLSSQNVHIFLTVSFVKVIFIFFCYDISCLFPPPFSSFFNVLRFLFHTDGECFPLFFMLCTPFQSLFPQFLSLLTPLSFLYAPHPALSPCIFHFHATDTSDSDLELSMVRHQPEGLEQLQAQTKFTKKELQSLYRGFKNVRQHSARYRYHSFDTFAHRSGERTGSFEEIYYKPNIQS